MPIAQSLSRPAGAAAAVGVVAGRHRPAVSFTRRGAAAVVGSAVILALACAFAENKAGEPPAGPDRVADVRGHIPPPPPPSISDLPHARAVGVGDIAGG
jgi:hypothetical protein